YQKAAARIRNSKRTCAFTGSGISVESGIPPFRGKGGIYETYDSRYFDLSYFLAEPENCWKLLKEIFFDHLGKAEPNYAHCALADLEKHGLLQTVITQNIDNLHRLAGSTVIHEFHGNSQYLTCLACSSKFPAENVALETLPPHCKMCGGILKPDFVFFGENIPEEAYTGSLYEAEHAEIFLVIGTTGEVMPASMIPALAKRNGATIIEINPSPSNYTGEITDFFIRLKATEGMRRIMNELDLQ
ncbi:MAG: NAD-dependent protein deacylase, partial [FCB group bacterium]|nr:NAD-dependent protein deacylase [FCB group bacterium]